MAGFAKNLPSQWEGSLGKFSRISGDIGGSSCRGDRFCSRRDLLLCRACTARLGLVQDHIGRPVIVRPNLAFPAGRDAMRRDARRECRMARCVRCLLTGTIVGIMARDPRRQRRRAGERQRRKKRRGGEGLE